MVHLPDALNEMELVGVTVQLLRPKEKAKALITTCFEFNTEAGKMHLDHFRELRDAGIEADIYALRVSLGVQTQYAHKNRYEILVVSRPKEFADGRVTLRNIETGEQLTVAFAALVPTIERMLAANNAASLVELEMQRKRNEEESLRVERNLDR